MHEAACNAAASQLAACCNSSSRAMQPAIAAALAAAAAQPPGIPPPFADKSIGMHPWCGITNTRLERARCHRDDDDGREGLAALDMDAQDHRTRWVAAAR